MWWVGEYGVQSNGLPMRSPTADVNRVRQPIQPEAIVRTLIHAHSHPQSAKDKTEKLIRFRLVFPRIGHKAYGIYVLVLR